MPMWHNVLFANEKKRTYVSPTLVRRECCVFSQLVDERELPVESVGAIAPAWRELYTAGVKKIVDYHTTPQPDTGQQGGGVGNLGSKMVNKKDAPTPADRPTAAPTTDSNSMEIFQ